MKIFVTGATGYVGQAIIPSLLQQKYQIQCLIRPQSQHKITQNLQNTQICLGDLSNPPSIQPQNCQAIIHLVAIIRESKKNNLTFYNTNFLFTQTMINIALKYQIPRFLFMSSINSPFGILKNYDKSKKLAENCLKQSKLLWTIFKPSLIYSHQFWGKSAGWAKWSVPFFSSFQNFQKWTPISLNQIAKILSQALLNHSYIYQSLSGKNLFLE